MVTASDNSRTRRAALEERDAADLLAAFRRRFLIPDGLIYMNGNSSTQNTLLDLQNTSSKVDFFSCCSKNTFNLTVEVSIKTCDTPVNCLSNPCT